MNLPNKLTVLRILMIPAFLVFLLGGCIGQPQSRYAALIIFAAAALTDALDGYIARSRNLVTDFGKFADPLADKLLVSAALIAMTELGWLPAWVVVVIISREFIITGLRSVAASKNIILAAGFWGKLKTVAQMIMIVYIILGLDGTVFSAVKTLLIALAVLFTLVSAVEYIVKNISIIKDM
ncbi:MAG: CDP-diacylglycerol--glycerol-3-phosphate 3-phosphatidyltransferase [Clostridiales bacterium]|jgi:CDP-diacylglycerol--glycerol-3-phosphate 3-phosphatidyltransferase|nr:CDP-diacylglycerol--glycerol-3-phosphate 3-phosphatidyltransferase [Clostridiales bacterium]